MLGKSISNITPFTLLDYPHQSACILWYAGCNMRCLYCYNPEIVLGKGAISFNTVLDFLNKRKGLLDAVVFSGGECLIHKTIFDHIAKVKEMGFLVKIDTNGSIPNVLKRLLEVHLVDYVALDFKALPAKFETITKSKLFTDFETTFTILKAAAIPFEIRTTYHSELFSNNDIIEMQKYLHQNKYTGTFYIQNFVNGSTTLSPLPNSVRLKLEIVSQLQTPAIVMR